MADVKKVKLEKTKLEAGDKIVNLRDRVKVVATDKNPHSKPGTVTHVSEMVAEKGRKLGYYEKK